MRTCSAPRSAAEYTATVRMPRRRAVRMMRQAISPRLAIRTLLIIASHPEDAVRRFAGISAAGGGAQRQSEHLACIGRVDHAVVPKSRTGIGRVALRLVLPPDVIAETALVFLGPGLAATLHAFALDD